MDELETAAERGLANFGSLSFELEEGNHGFLWSNTSIFAGESRYGFLDQLSAEENVECYSTLTSHVQNKLFAEKNRFTLNGKLREIGWSSGEAGEFKDAWKDRDKYDPPFPN